MIHLQHIEIVLSDRNGYPTSKIVLRQFPWVSKLNIINNLLELGVARINAFIMASGVASLFAAWGRFLVCCP